MTPPHDPVAVLERWRDCGAIWRVLARTPPTPHRAGSVTVGMFTCTGDEEVDRFTSSDPRLLLFIDEQQS